ncbi:MAG: HPF/RaiA family ribosome-associated protein [Gemmatimonadaceae bacterium]
MEIIFHGHRAPMSPRLTRRAREGVSKLARRLGRPVDAIVRFEEDGPARRVEITLHSPRQKPIIADARARYTGTALSQALDRLGAQVDRVRRQRLARRVVRA